MGKQNQVDYDSSKLQELANKLSLHFWGTALTIPIRWNGRLSKSMGRFLYRTRGKVREPVQIEISKYAAQWIDRQIFLAVILHEMCHYHMFIQNRPFADHHPEFEQELQRVGAISTNTVKLPEKVFKLSCSACGKFLGSRKRMNITKYYSSCCRGKINREEAWVGSFQYDGKIIAHSKVRILPANSTE
jgi:SprT-like protein